MVLSIETTLPHGRGYIKLEDTVAVTDTGRGAFGDSASAGTGAERPSDPAGRGDLRHAGGHDGSLSGQATSARTAHGRIGLDAIRRSA
jgi:hypothetical protein